jgi:hypothetical protein
MDESGARVRCLGGEHVIVLVKVKELYTTSPRNQKSVLVSYIVPGAITLPKRSYIPLASI